MSQDIPTLPTRPTMTGRRVAREARVLAALVVAFVAVLLVASALTGCATSQAHVEHTARVASNAGAAAIKIAEGLELARLRQLAKQKESACEVTNTTCRNAAIDAAFAEEKQRTDTINAALTVDDEIAQSLIGWDGCSSPGAQADVQWCQANELVLIAQKLPDLATLIAQVKKAVSQ